jgi:uptake hydrogenase large subunit
VGFVTRVDVHEEIPRSEGDLRIYWDERDGRIDAAWCQGTMYRGYEMILIGRHPEDALATTARLCGICSTSHVVAATDALEKAWNIVPPAQAVRLRNLFLAAESLMSDARQSALFFGRASVIRPSPGTPCTTKSSRRSSPRSWGGSPARC